METIRTAAARLGRGETTAVELIEASLSAIERHGRRTNAFTRVHAELARDEAAAVDDERARGVRRGPLHGIPISLKDLIDEAGQVTTGASHVLDDRIADRDATVVTRLRAAGAIVIGRTNLHQFALGTTSDESSFGPVRHPQDVHRSPGGSSGGSAAAVATGMGLASIGTDTGGSVRIPSAVCGLVGVKPSAGEVPTDGIIPLSRSFDTIGPIARSVQDASWLADVLAGRPPADAPPWPPAGLRLVRIGGYFEAPLESLVRAALDAALDRLAAAGAQITVRDLADTAAVWTAYTTIVRREGADWHGARLDTRRDAYLPGVRANLLEGRSYSAAAYAEALDVCRRLRRHVDALLDDADALVTATLPITAPLVGATEVMVDPDRGATMPIRAAMLKHTQVFNMTGHPAVSLPIACAGLPAGLQVVGRLHETPRLLSIAAGLEAALHP